MVSLTRDFKSNDLVRKIWGRYLQNEWKYDKYGALGKVLVIQEILKEEGIERKIQADLGFDYQQIANETFPRTFFCYLKRDINASQARAILRHFHELEKRLFESGLTGNLLYSTCIEETAEKFCISTVEAEKIVKEGVA